MKNNNGKLKYKFNFLAFRWIVFGLCLVLFTSTLFFEERLDNAIRENAVHYKQEANFGKALQNDFVVHFVDVGQGDCIMLSLPDGKKGIIDAGDNIQQSKNHILQYAKENVFDKNEQLIFDFAIFTHSDVDHIGGFDVIFENFIVNKIYRPAIFYDKTDDASSVEQTFANEERTRAGLFGLQYDCEMLELKATTCSTQSYFKALSLAYMEINQFGEPSEIVFSFAGLKIENEEVGYCLQFFSPTKNNYENVNDFSPIIVASYGGFSVCLTGDAEFEAENGILEIGGLPQVDALKLSHHGASSATSETFLNALNPKYVFISVGSGNVYGHPSDEILNRLHKSGITSNIFRTDLNGDLVFSVGDVNTENSENNVLIGISKLDGFFANLKWWHFYLILVVMLFFVCFFVKKYVTESKKIGFKF